MGFRSVPVLIGTSDTDVFEMGAGLSGAVVLGINNVHASARTYTFKFFKQSAATTYTLASGVSIAGATATKFPIPLSMEAGDKIILSASDASSLTAFATVTDSDAAVAKGFTPRGTWSDAVTYAKNDMASKVVSGRLHTYVSMQDSNLNQDPETQTAFWMLIFRDGEQGAAGDLTQAGLFAFTAWIEATEATSQISFDCLNGSRLNFFKVAAATAEVQAPANLPDGSTCYLELTPNGQTITWAAAYRAPVPAPVQKSLIAITRRGAEYIATLSHEGEAA